jgi:acyl phosphate:glycerol-3-phosphate acyltransferase
MFGHLVTRIFFQQDIRTGGSGNVGARNAGRLYGKKAFVLTFLGDALKGAAVILLGRYLGVSETVLLAGLALVIIGHLKPAVLGFKGGKGISTFIGGILTFEPLVAPFAVLALGVLYPFTKSFTLAGLGSLLAVPLVLYANAYGWANCLIVMGILGLLFLAHSENIKERLKR